MRLAFHSRSFSRSRRVIAPKGVAVRTPSLPRSSARDDATTLVPTAELRAVIACGRGSHPDGSEPGSGVPELLIPLERPYVSRFEKDGTVQTIAVPVGTGLFLPAQGWQQPQCTRATRMLRLQFGAEQMEISVLSFQSTPVPPAVLRHATAPMGAPVPQILKAMLELGSDANPALVELANALVRCARQSLGENANPSRETRERSIFRQASAYLQTHFNSDVNRDAVAHQLGVSPGHLSRIFRRQGYLKFVDYLTQVRINHSKGLLCHRDLKIQVIAVECGFHDAAHFCRVFKRFTHVTPLWYRLKLLRQADQHTSLPVPESAELACP
jgi:AraC-like DNA-binding protein